MKAKLIIEGKEIEVEISEEECKKLQSPEEKKTGYERVPESDVYFYTYPSGCVETTCETCYDIDDECYESANYYSDKTVAENNTRADKLMRQLRRFSVEHRERGISFDDINIEKYYICYDYASDELEVSSVVFSKNFGAIYFDSKETARAAIDEFHDELIWYFTEYKDSL